MRDLDTRRFAYVVGAAGWAGYFLAVMAVAVFG